MGLQVGAGGEVGRERDLRWKTPSESYLLLFYCSVLAESALTALQYFPFAGEFPPLSLQVLLLLHGDQWWNADVGLREPCVHTDNV